METDNEGERFTEEQTIDALQEQEAGTKTADLARKHEDPEAILHNHKVKFGGIDFSDATCQNPLGDENGKLNKLVADFYLDQAKLQRAGSGLLNKGYKWTICLDAAQCRREEKTHEQTSPPEP